ncbi:GNAT family N-acetyltransferase [Winogradskyella sp.]|uniref:GNAT family N-acetyltransferase n=1 Tax=Winogradskyella sp. TaxID=1883156 RepID=UPI003BA9EF71
MISRPIEHQFEFWTHLGNVGGYIHQYDGYTSLLPLTGEWPSKIYNLQNANIAQLKTNILECDLPKSIALDAEDKLNLNLEKQGFTKKSVVEGMSLKVKSNMTFKESSNITEVVDQIGIQCFANIASEAFGYNIDSASIIGLLKNDRTQLYLRKCKDQFVSCGILFLDIKGDSGLHMIGVNKKHRGLGLGKEMTQHLLFNALKNQSENIHLVASKFGAPIYKNYGFLNKGYLNSYTL